MAPPTHDGAGGFVFGVCVLHALLRTHVLGPDCLLAPARGRRRHAGRAAAGMNFFAYWNSDSMVLSMYGAQEVDARTAPDLYAMVAELAQRAGLPMPTRLSDGQPAAERLRDRPQSRRTPPSR